MSHFSWGLASTVCRKGETLLAVVTNPQQVFLMCLCVRITHGGLEEPSLTTAHLCQSWWWPMLLLGQVHLSELRPSRGCGCFWVAVERISLGNQKNSKRYMGSTVMHTAKAATWVYSTSAMSPSHLAHLPTRGQHATWRVFSQKERQEDEKQSGLVRSHTNPLRWQDERSPGMRGKGEVDTGL